MSEQIINIIPKNYKGDPKAALGYCWQNIVKRIPGNDFYGGLQDCLDDLEAKHGPVAIKKCPSNLGTVSDTAKTRHDDREIDITDVETIAYINCMWCGGSSYDVFVIPVDAKASEASEAANPGGDIAETVESVKLAAKKKADLMNAKHNNHKGWCEKCHSFCYGDCESN